jgi:hypothetical protein
MNIEEALKDSLDGLKLSDKFHYIYTTGSSFLRNRHCFNFYYMNKSPGGEGTE